MPNMKEMYPSKWLTAKDLDGEDKVVTIRRIEEESIAQEDKWVLYFDLRQTTKGLVLNQTNAKSIAKLYGEDTDDWINKSITLYPTEVQFKGDMVEAIRVRNKAPKPPAVKRQPDEVGPLPKVAAKVTPMTQADVDLGIDDDEIPF